ncbi:MAG: HAD family phosphatase [bacterium]|nr:HAD family phosphatase [bacterium]
MITAIVSDFFGVIAGSGFYNTYALAGGDPKIDREFIKEVLYETNMGQITSEEMVQKLCVKLNITPSVWEEARVTSEAINQPLLDYYKSLKPKYKIAILSNANTNSINKRLTPEQLETFDVIVVSADVGMIKPDAEIYKLTAERLGVEPHECLFTDDSQPYVDAAIEVGMKAVLFEDNESLKKEIELYTSAD